MGDGEFAVGAASVEGEVNLLVVVVKIEGIFHFVAVAEVAVVGEHGRDEDGALRVGGRRGRFRRGGVRGEIVLAEDFLEQGAFLL